MTARKLTLAALALVTVAWAAVTIASLGALSQACRYVELGEAEA